MVDSNPRDVASTGDNSIYLPSRLISQTAFMHELLSHVLGTRNEDSHIRKVSPTDKEFSIRTERFAEGVDKLPENYRKEYFDPETRTMRTGLNEDLRVVTSRDIYMLQPKDGWKKDAKSNTWRAWIGGASNTFFTGELSIDDKRKYLKVSKQINPHIKGMTYEKAYMGNR